MTGVLDVHGIILNSLVLCLADDHLVHAEHRVDGCSDLMRHLREELVLGLSGCNGRIDRILHLGVCSVLPADHVSERPVDKDDADDERRDADQVVDDHRTVDRHDTLHYIYGEIRAVASCGVEKLGA